jgi:hypothetical protein
MPTLTVTTTAGRTAKIALVRPRETEPLRHHEFPLTHIDSLLARQGRIVRASCGSR